MKIQWSPLALDQAEEALEFIAAQGRPGVAAAWLDGLFKLVRELVPFPKQGRVVPEVGREDIREIQYEGFRILYRISPDVIGILSVRHSRQQLIPEEVADD
jgi:plasmid stabilization system protein ParE